MPLRGDIEEAGYESRLSPNIVRIDASKLPLPDHGHGLEAGQGSSCRPETAEAKPRPDKALNAPVVLLDDVNQIFALPKTGAAPEIAVPLHVRDRPWIGGVLVDRHRARIDGMRLRDRPAKEPFRRGRISPCRQQGSRSSARGCPPHDRDMSSVLSHGHRFRPRARSRCSFANTAESVSQAPLRRPGSSGRSSYGRPRRPDRGA